jgi:hypothetical protein
MVAMVHGRSHRQSGRSPSRPSRRPLKLITGIDHWNKGALDPSRLAGGILAREPGRGRSKPADRTSHSGRRRVQNAERSPAASRNPDIRSAIPGRTLLAAGRSFRKPKSGAPLVAGRRIPGTPPPRAHMARHYKNRHYKNLGRCNRSGQWIRR